MESSRLADVRNQGDARVADPMRLLALFESNMRVFEVHRLERRKALWGNWYRLQELFLSDVGSMPASIC